MAPLALCLCALAAHGIDAFGASRLSKRGAQALAAAAVAAGAALLALMVAPATTLELGVRLVGDAGSFYRSALLAGLPHLLVGLLALLAADRIPHAGARASALALVVALAPASAVYRGAHLGSPEAHRLATPLRLESDSPTPRIAHPAERIFYSGEGTDSNAASSFGAAWPMIARRFALTHVAIPLPFDPSYRESAELAITGAERGQGDGASFELWEVPHRPWAFFAESARIVQLPDDARVALHELEVAGDHDTVLVETPAQPSLAPGRVHRVERSGEYVRIEAESDGPGLLIVQDAFWPGWRASIDGPPAEVIPADYLVRAVRWPPGRHVLEMVYDPPELRVGLAFSALGVFLASCLAVRAVRRTCAGTKVSGA
jgi:hypothetical protein